jgi:uncharacterized membrane protein YsdA (DUF1294 family)
MSGLMLIGAWYAVLSGLTFAVYAVDKRAARQQRRRIPELTLHALELAGGWPGAFCAQRLIRHKNAKVSYQIIYWLIVALHAAAWFAWLRWSHA